MERITRPVPGGDYILSSGEKEEAIQRLGQFEDAYERLILRREEIVVRMEELRGAGRQKSAQFRELLGEKLTIQNMLLLLESCGIC